MAERVEILEVLAAAVVMAIRMVQRVHQVPVSAVVPVAAAVLAMDQPVFLVATTAARVIRVALGNPEPQAQVD